MTTSSAIVDKPRLAKLVQILLRKAAMPFDDPASSSDESDPGAVAGTQQSQTQSQVKGERVWKLCNADMRVLGKSVRW